MPSTRYIEVSTPAIKVEGIYIAPANGYMVGEFYVRDTKFYWLVNESVGFLGIHSYGSGEGIQLYRAFCPIGKGQKATFNIEQGSYGYIRFYFAEGN